MNNNYKIKPQIDGLGVTLLVLLGIRAFFSALLFLNYANLLYLIFSSAYFIALFGTYKRDLYGPIVGIIIIAVDILFAIGTSSFTPAIFGALVVDFAIFGCSLREYGVINNFLKSTPSTNMYQTSNIGYSNQDTMNRSDFTSENNGTDQNEKSREYGRSREYGKSNEY